MNLDKIHSEVLWNMNMYTHVYMQTIKLHKINNIKKVNEIHKICIKVIVIKNEW